MWQQYIEKIANHWLVRPKGLYLCRWSFGHHNEWHSKFPGQLFLSTNDSNNGLYNVIGQSTKFSTPQILIVAWPHGNTMMGSIRKVPDGAPGHAAPPELTNNISLAVIPKGTFLAPSGDWQYTFVCSGCLDRKDAYPATGATENLAWALSSEPLREPANRAGPLNHHHGGSGKFTADMAGARHERYPQWAEMAAPRTPYKRRS